MSEKVWRGRLDALLTYNDSGFKVKEQVVLVSAADYDALLRELTAACTALADANITIDGLEDTIRDESKIIFDLEAENARLRDALQGVREAIAMNGHTYHEPDWNPDAHVEITLTVAEVRLVRNAFDD